MNLNEFEMPSKEEIEKYKKKYGEIVLICLDDNGKKHNAIVRMVKKKTLKGIDLDNKNYVRKVWDRVKIIYSPEFEINDDLIGKALYVLTEKR